MKQKICVPILTVMLVFSASAADSFQMNFTPRLSVGEEYTDNVFLSDENTESDFITTVSPGFTLEMLEKSAGLQLSYDPSYAFYNEFDENNAWRHQADLSAWAALTKNTKLDLRDSFVNTDDPLSEDDIAVIRTTDPSLPVDTSVRRGRNRYSRNYAAVNLNHQFGPADYFRIGYAHTLLENDDPDIEDSSSNRPSAGLTWWFLPFWGVDLSGDYTRGQYEISDDLEKWYGSIRLLKRFSPHLDGYLRYSHTLFNYEGETEDDTTYNPAAGIDYAIADDLTFNLEVGYFINKYEKREDQDGLTLDTRLTQNFRRGSIYFFARTGYDQSIGQSEDLGYEIFYDAGASATYRFTRYVSGNINGFYRYSDYVDSLADRQDDQVRASAGISVAPLSWMTIDLGYSYRLLESTDDTNEYQENRAMLSITLAPATPYRVGKY